MDMHDKHKDGGFSRESQGRSGILFFSLFHSVFQIIKASWYVRKLRRPIISIFGGSRVPVESPYAKQATELAELLVRHRFAVLTGGGFGIMRAAMQGASHAFSAPVRPCAHHMSNVALGIGVSRIHEGFERTSNNYIEVNQFWARKFLLTRYSAGVVIFPGGFGTLDELGEVLTLLQTQKIADFPVVLISTEYWRPLVSWINNEAVVHGLIDPEHVKLFVVTDDLAAALHLLCKHCGV